MAREPLAYVVVSHHAHERYQQRVGRISRHELRRLVIGRLQTCLRRGTSMKAGCIWVWLSSGVAAVMTPRARGGWLMVTVLGPKEARP